MSEIRSILPEIKIFSTVTTWLRTFPRGNLITQTTGISRKFTALFLLSAHRKKYLNPNLSTQYKLSKKLSMSEIRPVLAEIKIFFTVTTCLSNVKKSVKKKMSNVCLQWSCTQPHFMYFAYISTREFNYVDNWNFAKFTALFLLSAHRKKKYLNPNLSTQYKLSKKLRMSEIRPVLAEIKVFSAVTTRVRTCPRENLMGHFRVLLCLCFKTRLSAEPFI